MARFTFEDLAAGIPAVMFPDALALQSELVADDHICFLQGRVDRSREQVGLIVDKVVPIERAAEQFTKLMIIRLDNGVHERDHLERLNAALRMHPGPTAVMFDIRTAKGKRVSLRADQGLGVRTSEALVQGIAEIIGPHMVRFAAGNGKKAEGGR